jgi:hypothetical protein
MNRPGDTPAPIHAPYHRSSAPRIPAKLKARVPHVAPAPRKLSKSNSTARTTEHNRYDCLGQLHSGWTYDSGGNLEPAEKFGFACDAAQNLSARSNSATVTLRDVWLPGDSGMEEGDGSLGSGVAAEAASDPLPEHSTS